MGNVAFRVRCAGGAAPPQTPLLHFTLNFVPWRGKSDRFFFLSPLHARSLLIHSISVHFTSIPSASVMCEGGCAPQTPLLHFTQHFVPWRGSSNSVVFSSVHRNPTPCKHSISVHFATIPSACARSFVFSPPGTTGTDHECPTTTKETTMTTTAETTSTDATTTETTPTPTTETTSTQRTTTETTTLRRPPLTRPLRTVRWRALLRRPPLRQTPPGRPLLRRPPQTRPLRTLQ